MADDQAGSQHSVSATQDTYPPRVYRYEVRRVICPRCRARGGEPCIGKNGRERISHHIQRVRALQKLRESEPRLAGTGTA